MIEKLFGLIVFVLSSSSLIGMQEIDFNTASNFGVLSRSHGRSKGRLMVGDDNVARLYRHAMETNDPKSQYELGLLFKEGSGVTQNNGEAFRWWSKAAKQGEVFNFSRYIIS